VIDDQRALEECRACVDNLGPWTMARLAGPAAAAGLLAEGTIEELTA
jgi:hypothetical protein